MNIFNTPAWEINNVGDENAKKLFNTNVIKQNSLKSKITKITYNRLNISENTKTKKTKKKFSSALKNKHQFKNPKSENVLNNNSNRTQLILEKEDLTGRNNLGSIVNRKQSNIQSLKKNVVNTNSFGEKVKRKLVRQTKYKLKNKNKLIKYSKISSNDRINNELHHHKQKKAKFINDFNLINSGVDNSVTINTKKAKLINLLSLAPTVVEKKNKSISLRDRMIEKLKSSRFRYINEQIYNSESKEAQKYFKSDPDAFYAYHEGYKQQVSKWPLNPVDVIIKSIRKMPMDYVIADFGCGEAKLGKSVSQKVYSYDLVASNEYVTACDMSRVPLNNESINVVVFCLSLMGSNIREYIFEANRILKSGGILKIAEVESRFDTVDVFIEGVKHFGFVHTWKDLSHNLFYFLDFKKISKCKPLNKLPTISLHPCLYKKR